ncbi:MAG: RMD1 family protein [Spirosomataceae bacterium]
MKIEAYQVAEVIHLKKFRSEYTNSPLVGNNSELFYREDADKYFYLFNYGVVAFAGYDDLGKSNLLKFIKNYAEDPIEGDYREDFTVHVERSKPFSLQYDSLTVETLTDDTVRIIALNIAQSVSLDYYEDLTYQILKSTQQLTEELEKKGRLNSSKTDLLKFIGRTLNIKNSIIDNLYIFDAPDIVWESEFLEKIDESIKKTFDLRMRYRDIDYKLKIVQESLMIFTDLLQNRESTRLEWVIIILILIEVAHVIFQWFF